jgi:hypothetical protein
VRTDPNFFYASALIQDSTNRRPVIARINSSSGQIARYLFYTANNAEYASDQKVPVVRRMNLYEDEVGGVHIISACL